MDGVFGQLPYKCYVASVGDSLKICPGLDSRVVWEHGVGGFVVEGGAIEGGREREGEACKHKEWLRGGGGWRIVGGDKRPPPSRQSGYGGGG